MPLDTQRPTTYFFGWLPKLGFGHAALVIDSQRFAQARENNSASLLAGMAAGGDYNYDALNNDNYVSWYSTPKGFFLTGLRAKSQTYCEDALFNQRREPNKMVAITELDRDAMREAWAQIRDKVGANWKLFDKNCATVVARVLKAGGANQYCRNKGKSHPLYWTPLLCYQYAKSIAKHSGVVVDE